MTDEAKTTDPVTALVRLRAAMVRLAHEVDGLADCAGIRNVRAEAPVLANRLRDMAMAPDIVEASKR